MGHFKGYFEGAKTLLTTKLSRAQRRAFSGTENRGQANLTNLGTGLRP